MVLRKLRVSVKASATVPIFLANYSTPLHTGEHGVLYSTRINLRKGPNAGSTVAASLGFYNSQFSPLPCTVL